MDPKPLASPQLHIQSFSNDTDREIRSGHNDYARGCSAPPRMRLHDVERLVQQSGTHGRFRFVAAVVGSTAQDLLTCLARERLVVCGRAPIFNRYISEPPLP